LTEGKAKHYKIGETMKPAPVTIGVISDTHARNLEGIPAPVLTALAGVDLIVHAGDFTERAVLEGLRTLGEVKAVCGNMDSAELKGMLPRQDLFMVGGKRVGLIHGSGAPWGIANRVRNAFPEVDIIIFGHSHQACNRFLKGSLLFNPGRVRDSFGILETGDEIKAEIRPV
jgi:putative phosphoesterase